MPNSLQHETSETFFCNQLIRTHSVTPESFIYGCSASCSCTVVMASISPLSLSLWPQPYRPAAQTTEPLGKSFHGLSSSSFHPIKSSRTSAVVVAATVVCRSLADLKTHIYSRFFSSEKYDGMFFSSAHTHTYKLWVFWLWMRINHRPTLKTQHKHTHTKV